MQLRIARHTLNLKPIIDFYTRILGLNVLGEFTNHASYDGVFLGIQHLNWHLEFTTTGESVDHQFDEDDLLVFYPESEADFNEIIVRIEKNNIKKIAAKNPYWQENGITIKDPDGYRIVISPLKLSKQ
jgi:catechol 2,3-dioxygenase-like lactoylglutathione lyase family enzyme